MADIDFKHSHWLPFWEPDCKKCELNQILNQMRGDREMIYFYIHNSELFNYWEKQTLKERYCK